MSSFKNRPESSDVTPSAMAAPLSETDVLNKRFQTTKFRRGYDQDNVDDFLDEVVATLRGDAARPVTADDVRGAHFAPTRFREGYDPAEVDEFMDLVLETLAGAAPSPEPLGAPWSDTTSPRRAPRPSLSDTDVLNSKFQATKFREGYDADEVDDYLDRVVATLRGNAAQPLTAEDVRNVQFARTKYREGYDIDEVDDLLDRVIETLAS
jgi:DivIVA domain-containing protein